MHRRWQQYWFAPGGQLAVAVLRIAIALSLLWTLRRLALPAEVTTEGYRAVGILRLLGGDPPTLAMLHATRIVALVAATAMLVGVGTRAATVVATLSTIVLASYAAAHAPSWSHQHNAPLLAGLAFFGACGGDALAVDAWWRRWRGTATPDRPEGYQWSIRLVQLAMALMFFSGALNKLRAGGYSLDWALSDNLRHQLLVRYDLAGRARTDAADWLLQSAWRWRAAACLNIVAQCAPLAAVFAVAHPRWRAALGVAFVTETIALGVVMDFWKLPWLPLAVVFVDWDALVARWRPRRGVVAQARSARPHPRWLATGFVAVFVLYDGFVAISRGRIDQWLNSYPFSAFPMFSVIRATPPYDRHLPYDFPGGRLELIADPPVAAGAATSILDSSNYRALFQLRDPDELRERLVAVLRDAQGATGRADLRGARLYLTAYEVPAYPAPARLVPRDLAIIAELGADGVLHTALGRVQRDGATFVATARPAGVVLSEAPAAGFVDASPTPIALPVPTAGTLRAGIPTGKVVHVAVQAKGPDGVSRPWLVGQLAGRRGPEVE